MNHRQRQAFASMTTEHYSPRAHVRDDPPHEPVTDACPLPVFRQKTASLTWEERAVLIVLLVLPSILGFLGAWKLVELILGLVHGG